MTNENKLMLQLLKAYLHQNKIEIDADIDLMSLYKLSKAHNLAATVFSVIKDTECAKAQKDAYRAFEGAFYDAIPRYDMQKGLMEDFSQLLSQQAIKHVLFKGAEIKEYFPFPELRSMGDIDVLIATADRDRVKALLEANGYTSTAANGPVYNYTKDGVLFEVHTSIVNGKVASTDAPAQYFAAAMEHASFEGFVGRLEPSYHLEYLLTHIAHHFWFYGAGVKLILDLAVMLMHFDIDLDTVLEHMDAIDLGKFSKIIITICHSWFGVGQAYDVDTEATQEFLTSYGAFGNKSRNSSAVVQRKALEEGKSSRLATGLALAFPSYKKMKDLPYIPFINGRPYLLPVGWVYRFFYNVKYKNDFLKASVENLGNSKTVQEAKQELQYFEEIGLL